MKSYLFSIPERLRKASESLDAQAILCKKSWEVFNDEGIKQVFIFKNDGSLIISSNGDVVKSRWEYLSTNHSIIIDEGTKATMLHPAFIANAILALQKDGTKEMVFLIDEFDKTEIQQRSLEGLKNYFAQKEHQAYLESAEYKEILRRKQQQEEDLLRRKRQQEEALLRRKQQQEEALLKEKQINEKKMIVACLIEHKDEILRTKRVCIITGLIFAVIFIVSIVLVANSKTKDLGFVGILTVFFFLSIILVVKAMDTPFNIVKKYITLKYLSEDWIDTLYYEVKKTW